MKSKSPSTRPIVAACALLISVSATRGAVVESFESGDLNGWGAGTLNGVTTTVNTDHATDGSFGAMNSFVVPGGFGGWTVNTILEIDPRTIMDASATSLSLDAYSDWANPNGWGVYGNTIMLILNNSGGWTTVGPSRGALANGSFQTLSWDLTQAWGATRIAERITDPGLGYSVLSIAWHVGTWAGEGADGEGNQIYTDNGTQTLAIDNITIIPEPSSLVLLAGGLLALRRRR